MIWEGNFFTLLYYDANGGTHGDAQQIAILGAAVYSKTIATTDFIIGV